MWLRTALCAALLVSVCAAESTDSGMDVDLETRALRDFYDEQNPNQTNEKRLLGALHEVLEKLQTKRIGPWEKKYGHVPICEMGEHCAIRKGSRIGKMCDCPRRALCNFFLLKCL